MNPIGTYTYPYPQLVVLRGYDPQSPSQNVDTYPISVDGGGNTIPIYSGQIVSLTYTGGVYVWSLGCQANSTPYIALNNYNDTDVASAGITGSLPALSCAGNFVVRSAFYKTGQTYNVDTPLTYDGVTGNVKPGVIGTDAILGFVVRNHGLMDVSPFNSSIGNGPVYTIEYQTKLLSW